MVKTNKISFYQLAVLLFVSRLCSEAMSFPLEKTQYGMQRFTVILTSYVIVFLLYIPLIYISRHYRGESAMSLISDRSKGLGWLCGLIISAALLISAITAICRMNFYASSTVFANTSSLPILLLLLASCGYCAYKGIQGAARSSVIFAAVFAGFLILISVSLWNRFDWNWLYPAFLDEPDRFIPQVIEQVGSNSEILVFAVLAEHVRDKAQKTVYWYLPAVMIMLELMFLIEMTVLGPFLSSVSFPFFSVAALSDIVLFQRLDGIDVAVWTLMCITKAALTLISIRTIFTRLAGKTAGLAAAGAGFAAVALVTLVSGSDIKFVEALTKVLTSCIPMLAGGFVIPIIAIIIAKCKKKAKGDDTDEETA